MKKVLILEGSPRRNGNSVILSNEFARGAEETGYSVEKIHIVGRKIARCLGCNACYRNGGVCVQKDDMAEVREKMLAALHGFTCCVPNAKEGGVVLGVGVMEAGEIRSSTAMTKAYELGRSL